MSNAIIVQIPTKQVPKIELLFEGGESLTIPVLSLVRGVSIKDKRPIGFYYEPNQPTYGITREEFMRWLHEEFVHIFDKDNNLFQTHLSILDYKTN